VTATRSTRRWQLAVGLGRQLARLVAAMAAMRLGAAIVGPAPTAAVAATAATVGGVRWWARVVEPRLFAPRTSSPASHPQLGQPSEYLDDARRHLAFAQALAAVANRYLAQCEAEHRRLATTDRPHVDLDRRTLDLGAEPR
jgi:hypothetical protein